MFAGGTPAHGWVGAGADARRLAHGVNTAGLVVTLDGDPDLPALDGMLPRLLEQADDAATARKLLTGEWGTRRLDLPGSLVSVVSGGTGWGVELGEWALPPKPLSVGRTAGDASLRFGGWEGPRGLARMEGLLRGPRRAATAPPRSVLLAGRGPDGPLLVLLGLGSSSSAVLMRVWPGHTVAPPAGSIEAQPAPLGEIAAKVDELISRGVLTEAEVQSAVAGARAAALAEGDHAEHQAELMDAYGDDSGATVRRLVAQSHAGTLAETALRGLLERASGKASL
jgi:hypothetical protein